MVPPPPLPIPDGLIRIWIHYEYFKRTPFEVAQKSVCDAVFSPDDETAKRVTDAWRPAPHPDPEPENLEPETKRVKPNPEEEEPEEDYPDASPDDSFTPPVQLRAEEREQLYDEYIRALATDVQMFPDNDHQRDIRWKKIKDNGHPLPRVLRFRDSLSENGMMALYKRFEEKEIKYFEKKRGSLEDADIIQLLTCRKYCAKDEKTLLDDIKLPIKKMRIVTDYWKIKVEIYRDPESKKHLNFQFWRHKDGCLLWTEGENVRLIGRETYQTVAAEYVVAIMKHPKMRFKELIFDIEPWYKGPAEFPNLDFYVRLREQLNSALDKKKVKVRHLFMRSCFSVDQRDQWKMVVPFLRSKYLKLITLRIWDDEHVDELEKRKRLAYRQKMSDTERQLAYDVAFQSFPPRQRSTITVETDLNLMDLKWCLDANIRADTSQGFARFESDTKRRSVTMKLYDRKIIMDSERVPEQELDDVDLTNVSSDESWTEKEE
ncbi:hypothetical protein CAEBREN_20400 [Caenorhabditis brenneri]|uniref:DUF38 domain-containing protein n=1 Tax=Caenorhabditis brenneri TaxID=135651 RepID=G0N6Y2_CAEBE|nr:hypothetical protein CAEBREN_20400 [Caenorhabditis brenneri]